MSDITNYLQSISSSQRTELERIMRVVKRLVPDAAESISYGMPAYKYKKKPLIYMGAFKNHMSLFPTAGPSEALKDKLKDYKITKGTIQFTTENPLPEELLEKIVLYRKNIIDSK